MHILTKTKVMSGLQCQKKLWFDVNSPNKIDSHLFHIGNRFGEFARNYFGTGLNLALVLNAENALDLTNTAIKDPHVSVIYEAAFIYSDTLVRPDVLLRKGNSWEMIEIKASTSLKDEHVRDATIQSYILKACGLNLETIKVGHINSEFTYKGNQIYDGLLTQVEITSQIKDNLVNVQNWIDDLKYLGKKGAPEPQAVIGDQCFSPYPCGYMERCQELIPKLADVPISIIPYAGKKLAKEWASKDIYDLRDLPTEALKKPLHKIIQQSHIQNLEWKNPLIKKKIEELGWPRYFMDFETVQQGVPLVSDTKPYQALPFQWSIHKWDSKKHRVSLDDGEGFLEFFKPNMELAFLSSLIDALGDTGPIFVHNASFEKTILKSLILREDCENLKNNVDQVISRIVDTLEIVRDGFYSPKMGGSYSLKDIVKAIPTNVNYADDDSLSGGGEAQIAWFKCTDHNTSNEEKTSLSAKLKKYCGQDTLAMYDLIKYLTE